MRTAHARGKDPVRAETPEPPPVSLAAPPEKRARPRWLALDLFRFVAVLSMVQGHTFYVTMLDGVRGEPWYRWHAYVHGYTAPVFLFAAGLSFGIATFPRWDRHVRWGPTVRTRLERYVMLLVIAYLLQIPRLDLSVLWDPRSDAQLARVLKVDALQHIGTSLLIAQALIPIARTKGRFLAALVGLGAVSTLVGPWLWRQPVERFMHPFFAAYVNDHTGSIFPLAPWSAFIFAGALVAFAILHFRVNRTIADVTAGLALVAGLFLLVAFGLDRTGVDALLGEHNFWKTSPLFFFWRLGVVMLLLATLGLVDIALERAQRARAAIRPLEILGQESLVLYVTHLLILYGSPIYPGLVRFYRRELGLGGSLVAFLSVWVAVCIVGFVWYGLKTKRPAAFRGVKRGLWAVVAAIAVWKTFL